MNHTPTKNTVAELSIWRMVMTVLALVFIVEFGIMFLLLPAVLSPETPDDVEALIDASALTIGLVPLLWIAVVRPLRRAALGERARAAALVSTASDGIITMDRRTVIQTVNPAVERMFGVSAGELVGRPIDSLFANIFDSTIGPLPPSDEFDGDGVRGLSDIEITGVRANGELIPLTISLSGFRYGDSRYLTAILHDMSERKRVESQMAARAQQQSVVSELGQQALATQSLDELLDQVVAHATSTLDTNASLILGFSRDDNSIIKAVHGIVVEPGEECSIELSEADRGLLETELVQTHRLHDVPFESDLIKLLKGNGIESITSCVINGTDGAFGCLIVCHADSLDLALNERSFLRSLSNVVGAALQRTRAEAELREKETIRAGQMALIAQVATGVAHEIRNPLTSIKLICQTPAEEATDTAQSEDLNVVTSEIRRMEQTVNVFLDYARPPQSEIQVVDLGDLIRLIAKLMEKKCTDQNVTLQVKYPDQSMVVLGDPSKLKQVVLNLCLNALSVMLHGGKLVLAAERREDCCQLTVTDSGPGVPIELQQKIFDPFFTTKETGVGLGLVISRQIAVDHGGTLELEPTDVGARFVLTLPSSDREKPAVGGSQFE